jgi:hypothetical protein
MVNGILKVWHIAMVDSDISGLALLSDYTQY